MSKFVFEDNLRDYRPILMWGTAIYKRYSQIKIILNKRLGTKFAELFAEPTIPDDAFGKSKKGYWSSNYISEMAKPLSKCSLSDKNIAQSELSEILQKITVLADELMQSTDINDKLIGNILKSAIDIPSLNHIYFENGKIVLVAWGTVTEDANLTKFKLTKSVFNEELISPKLAEINEDKRKQEEKQPIINQNNTGDYENTSKPKRRFFTKKLTIGLLSVIAALIVLILVSYLYPRNTILPQEPGVLVPIDTNDIENDDQGRKIVGNRLNIAILSKIESPDKFAKDFRSAFPDNKIEIIYYDTITYRFQIRFPHEMRETLKIEIKTKLSQYELLIWDETIFKSLRKPNDPGFSNIQESWLFDAIGAYNAWDITTGDPGIIVAIIDNGFELNHPEFSGKIINPLNLYYRNSNVNTAGGILDHGTHVAATAIGLAGNNSGVSGIAPTCKFMPLQVADENGNMSSTAIIDAIIFATRAGASVINMSLGMPAPKGLSNVSEVAQMELVMNLYKDEEEFWNQLFERVESKNVTVVLAGGNDDIVIGFDPMQRFKNTIKVSAVDANLDKAPFSNYGVYGTISAPGVHIYSAVPGKSYKYMNGTSMAAPVVTGAIALIKSIKPDITNSEIIDLIQKTGKAINSHGKYVGNLIQIDKALMALNGNYQTPSNCDSIELEIDRLQKKIDSLKLLCTDSSEFLVIPPNAVDMGFLEGNWRSSNDLINSSKQNIALVFNFSKDGTGILTLNEPNGNTCKANLTISLTNSTLNIDQQNDANCNDGKLYPKYVFKCKADLNGEAQCNAQNTEDYNNHFSFKLYKIK